MTPVESAVKETIMRRRGVLLVAVALLLASVGLASGETGTVGCWVDRETIYIYGDADFCFENGVVAGCGTAENPYIIEGWRIVTSRADFGISVERTTRCFVIRNCVVIGGSGAAIRLNSLSNGAIQGCQLLRAERGILLENVSGVSILGNTLSENRRGVSLTLGSWGNVITKNAFVANGKGGYDPRNENHWFWEGVGNYWSDYAGEDCNRDGIGDTPYPHLNDPYPLMSPPTACGLALPSPTTALCGIAGHPVGCGTTLGTPCYVELPIVASPCNLDDVCREAPTCTPAVTPAVPCGPTVSCPHAPTCATAVSCPHTPACASASICEPATVCNPCVTPCEDQILNCLRTAVTLTADVNPGSASCAPCSIRWINERGEIVGTERSIMVQEPGLYTITIKGADGCSVNDSVAVFQDIAVPVVSASVDAILTCAVCDVGLVAHISGGRPPYAIEWTGPGGRAVGCEQAVRATAPGTYTVTVTGANGCSASASVVVEQDIAPPVVRATVDGTITCDQTAVTLAAEVTSGRGPYTYAWTKPGVDLVGSGSSITVSEGGAYTVTVTGANGCSGTATVSVQEDVSPPTVRASAGGTLTCSTTSVPLSASVSGGRPPYEVVWSAAGCGIVGEGTTISVEEPGTYTVTATGANGCWSSDTVVVEETIDRPVVDAGEDQLLTIHVRQAVLQAKITGCTGPCTVVWEDMYGEVVGTTESITVDRTGIYIATATNTLTGCSASDEVAVSSDLVSEVMLESSIEGLAVFGQLLKDGVPIPGTTFMFEVGKDLEPVGGEEVSSVRLTNLDGLGVEANGAEVNYIIPTNAIVRFTIHKDQFFLGKKYYLLHLPTDPEGTASIGFH